MRNRKKLVPALVLVLILALAPAAWAEEAEGSGALGPFHWLESWVASLMEELLPPAPAETGEAPSSEFGIIIIPSG